MVEREAFVTSERFMGWPSLMVGEASLSLLFVMPPRIAESHVLTGWLILGLSGQLFLSLNAINGGGRPPSFRVGYIKSRSR